MSIQPRASDWQEVSSTYTPTVLAHEIDLADELLGVLARSGLTPPCSLLEAGCGSGHLSLLLRKAGYRTDLLDFEPVALSKAREAYRLAFGDAAEKSEFIEGDLLKMGEQLEGRRWDVVWNSGVLEHFSDDTLERALEQMRALATRAVVFMVPNPRSVPYLAYRKRLLERQAWDLGVEFLREDYPQRLARAGLRVVRRGYCGKGFSKAQLTHAIDNEDDRRHLCELVESGTLPAETFYLSYFVCEPAEGTVEVVEAAPASDAIDRTYYLDALGAANAAAARLARSLREVERDRNRLREALHKTEAQVAAIEREERQTLRKAAALDTERARLVAQLDLEQRQRTRLIGLVEASQKLAQQGEASVQERERLLGVCERHAAHIERVEQELTRIRDERRALADRAATLQKDFDAATTERTRLANQVQALQRRVRDMVDVRDKAVSEHELLDRGLHEARLAAQDVVRVLEEFKTHTGFRVAHYMNLVRHGLLKGSLRSRARFAWHAVQRAALGRHRGEFGRHHALGIPQAEARRILDLLRTDFATLSGPAGVQTGPNATVRLLPDPRPTRLKGPESRRPHGSRRVAILTNMLLDWNDQRPRFGGGERYCWTLARLMRDLGLEVQFFQHSKVDFQGHYHGFPVLGFNAGNWFSEFNHGTCAAFADLARDFDHVVYNMPEYASGPVREDGLMICHGIWFDHDNYETTRFRTHEWFRHLGRTFSGVKRVVSVDTNSINVVRAMWPSLAGRMTFIPNFYDQRDFYPPASAPEDRPENDRLTVLFPRRSHRNRGSRILASILAAVPHDVRFFWVGEGDADDTDLIVELTRRDERLTFHRADFHEMPEWYRAADIAVIPTIACEGTSLSCLEALACGAATISTNVGGLSDLVHYGNTGLLVDPTPAAIADAINTLIEDEGERRRLREAGPAGARAFELARWRQRWTDVLREEGWVTEEQVTRAGFTTPHHGKDAIRHLGDARPAERPIEVRPAPNAVIVTRNAIHGGVESMIAIESRLLGLPVIVAGGHEEPETCPFKYTRVENDRELLEALKPYDVVLYHWLPSWAVAAIAESGLPSVEYVHRVDTAENDKAVPTCLVSNYEVVAEAVTRACGRRCEVIPLAVDTSRFTPPETLGDCVGAITSYNENKGLDVFLHAWARCKEEFPGLRVRFYGSGPLKDDLVALASRLGVDAEFREPVPDPERVLGEFRLFVVPSRIEGAVTVTAMEAMAMGVPVLVSRLPGVDAFLEQAALHGFPDPLETCAPNDGEALAEAMRRALRRTDRPTAREYMRLYYAPEVHARRVRDALASAAVRGRRPAPLYRPESSWADVDYLAGASAGPSEFYLTRVAEDGTPERVNPADRAEYRAMRFDNGQFPCSLIELSPSTRAVGGVVAADGAAGATCQISWLDASGSPIAHVAEQIELRPGEPRRWHWGNIPTGAARARITLRPVKGAAFRIKSMTVSALAADEALEGADDVRVNGAPA